MFMVGHLVIGKMHADDDQMMIAYEHRLAIHCYKIRIISTSQIQAQSKTFMFSDVVDPVSILQTLCFIVCHDGVPCMLGFHALIT